MINPIHFEHFLVSNETSINSNWIKSKKTKKILQAYKKRADL